MKALKKVVAWAILSATIAFIIFTFFYQPIIENYEKYGAKGVFITLFVVIIIMSVLLLFAALIDWAFKNK